MLVKNIQALLTRTGLLSLSSSSSTIRFSWPLYPQQSSLLSNPLLFSPSLLSDPLPKALSCLPIFPLSSWPLFFPLYLTSPFNLYSFLLIVLPSPFLLFLPPSSWPIYFWLACPFKLHEPRFERFKLMA